MGGSFVPTGLAITLFMGKIFDIGRIHHAPPIKIQKDLSELLSRINQYPRSKEILKGTKSIKDYKFRASLLLAPVPVILLFYLLENPRTKGGGLSRTLWQ